MKALSSAMKAVIGFVRLSLTLLMAMASKKLTGAAIVMKGKIVSLARKHV